VRRDIYYISSPVAQFYLPAMVGGRIFMLACGPVAGHTLEERNIENAILELQNCDRPSPWSWKLEDPFWGIVISKSVICYGDREKGE
jgi:uncharacterized membrane protein